MTRNFAKTTALLLFLAAGQPVFSQDFQLDYYLPTNFNNYGPFYGTNIWFGVLAPESAKYKLELAWSTFRAERFSIATTASVSHAYSYSFSEQRTAASLGLRLNYGLGLSGAYSAIYPLYEIPFFTVGEVLQFSDWNFAFDLLGYDLYLPWLPLSLGGYWRTTIGLLDYGPFMVGFEFGAKLGVRW